MIIALVEIAVRLPGARSLKEKRKLIRGRIQRSGTPIHVAVQEVADHDLWGNSTIAIAAIGLDPADAESKLRRAISCFEDSPEIEVSPFDFEIYRT